MPDSPAAAELSNGHFGAGGRVGFIGRVEYVITQDSVLEGCLEYMLIYGSTPYNAQYVLIYEILLLVGVWQQYPT